MTDSERESLFAISMKQQVHTQIQTKRKEITEIPNSDYYLGHISAIWKSGNNNWIEPMTLRGDWGALGHNSQLLILQDCHDM